MRAHSWAGAVRANRLQALATIAVMAWGVWQAVGAFGSPAAQQKLRDVLNLPAFLAGRTTAAVNDIMAHQLPADGVLRAIGGVLRWELFASAGPQVRAGCGGWLFLTEELPPPPDMAAMTTRAEAVGRIARALAARGITLVVAITPDKAQVQAAQLCGVPYSDAAALRHAEFTVRLRAAGVEPVDWLAPLGNALRNGPVYYRTDSHWDQRGASVAAAAIGTAAASLPINRETRFRTEAAAQETERVGDLLRLMSLDQVPNWLRPAPDREHEQRTVEIPGSAAPPAGGLLDDDAAATPEVVLLGSSFSLRGNFHGRLQEALSARVANFAQLGGGFSGAARSYFASPAWRENPPKLVVWEMLGRAVGWSIEAEERAFLANPFGEATRP